MNDPFSKTHELVNFGCPPETGACPFSILVSLESPHTYLHVDFLFQSFKLNFCSYLRSIQILGARISNIKNQSVKVTEQVFLFQLSRATAVKRSRKITILSRVSFIPSSGKLSQSKVGPTREGYSRARLARFNIVVILTPAVSLVQTLPAVAKEATCQWCRASTSTVERSEFVCVSQY